MSDDSLVECSSIDRRNVDIKDDDADAVDSASDIGLAFCFFDGGDDDDDDDEFIFFLFLFLTDAAMEELAEDKVSDPDKNEVKLSLFCGISDSLSL